jgi:hypothetical protein
MAPNDNGTTLRIDQRETYEVIHGMADPTSGLTQPELIMYLNHQMNRAERRSYSRFYKRLGEKKAIFKSGVVTRKRLKDIWNRLA